MADRHIKRLPVIDADGTLKGIASHADLLKVFLRTDEELATDIRLTVVDRLIPFSAKPSRSPSRKASPL